MEAVFRWNSISLGCSIRIILLEDIVREPRGSRGFDQRTSA